MKRHPCHSCSDREAHARWAERWWRLKRDHDRFTSQITGRTGAVAKIFDRVTEVLLLTGYLERDEHGRLGLSTPGLALRRIYGERDLLIAECLRRGLWDDLDAPALAAMAAAMIYEPRREEHDQLARDLPRGAFRDALDETQRLWATLDDLEREHKLPGTEPIGTGLSGAMHRWAHGARLDVVLRDADLAAGDFVRWSKQTIDLLDQLSLVADAPVASAARAALDAVRRGIVADNAVS